MLAWSSSGRARSAFRSCPDCPIGVERAAGAARSTPIPLLDRAAVHRFRRSRHEGHMISLRALITAAREALWLAQDGNLRVRVQYLEDQIHYLIRHIRANVEVHGHRIRVDH